MDDEMDMDDLFGDGAGLALPSRPPSKELHQRLDELRTGGCCQRIAWSKWGSIASIAANGTSLELRNLRCHPRDGTWALSEPTVTSTLPSTGGGGPLKHLCWSPTGSELAVADASGRITILSVFSSLNKPSLMRNSQSDPLDDLHAIVGCFWLNLAPYPPNRPAILHGPAFKDGANGYRYDVQQCPVFGPSHPNGTKSALVYLTTNGILKLLWPQNITGKWHESQNELESIASSEDLITHAAICPDKNGTLLIAYATTSKELHTVRALIEWNQPRVEKGTPVNTPISPTIKAKHIAVTSWTQGSPGSVSNISNLESSMTQLSHLEFMPLTLESQNRTSLPTIVAIRSHIPISTSLYNQETFTTVDRWEIREKAQSLNSAFEQLSSRRNSTSSPPGSVVYLKKLPSLTINKIIIHMEVMHLSKVVFFAYSDGSIEYRSRSTMLETYNESDLDRAMHLAQIGFTYADEEPCLQIALSPTFCSLVKLGNDSKLKWYCLDYHLGSIGSSMEDRRYAAFITTLTTTCATAVMSNCNYDDLLATAHKHASPQFAYDWLSEIARILKVHMDYSEEIHHDVLVRNTTIQLCLCIQNSLGFKGEFIPRTFSGKLAWIVLQLRNVVVLVTMAANLNISNVSDKVSPLEDPEVMNALALAGSVRWVLDLFAWIVDTLLTIPKEVPSTINLTDANKLSLPDLLAHLHSTNNISLHMLLSSPSRGFLTAICRRLTHLDYIARKAVLISQASGNSSNPPTSRNPGHSPASLSPALRAAYVQIATLTSDSILKLSTIDRLLSSVTTLVKDAYSTHSPPLTGSQSAERARNGLETKMVFGSSIPDALKNVIVEIYREGGLLETVKKEIKQADLFLADFTMLEIDEDEGSVTKRKALNCTMDCFRKSWMKNPARSSSDDDAVTREVSVNAGSWNMAERVSGATGVMGRQGARWRRCARCAAVMEDVLTHKQSLQWLIMQQRRCFCSGYFATVAPGKTFA